jgi:hypothetical protein
VFPRDMVYLRNISVDTLHKGDSEDYDDDDDDNNNNYYYYHHHHHHLDFLNIVILHLSAYEDGTDRVFQNVGI